MTAQWKKVFNKLSRNMQRDFGWHYVKSMCEADDPLAEADKRFKDGLDGNGLYMSPSGQDMTGYRQAMFEAFKQAYRQVTGT